MANFDPNTGALIPDDTNTSTPGVNQSGVPGFLQTVGQTLTGSNNPFTNASFIPAMANAALQFRDAGKYTDLGNQAAQRADPFGNNNNRQQYIDQLSALERDPSQIANTPGYKFALNQALDSTQSRLASQGLSGSTQMQNALTSQASGLAQQTYNNTIDQLSRLSGAQFDPANAARMQMEGGRLSLGAESNALNAMMYPFGPGAGGGTTINNNNSSRGGNGGGGNGGNGGGTNGANVLRPGQAGPGGVLPGAGTVANLWQRYLSNGSSTQGMDPSDVQILQDSGMLSPAQDSGGMDTAPITYNGGYGVGNINTSAGNIINTSPGIDNSYSPGLDGVTNYTGSDSLPQDFSINNLWG